MVVAAEQRGFVAAVRIAAFGPQACKIASAVARIRRTADTGCTALLGPCDL